MSYKKRQHVKWSNKKNEIPIILNVRNTEKKTKIKYEKCKKYRINKIRCNYHPSVQNVRALSHINLKDKFKKKNKIK